MSKKIISATDIKHIQTTAALRKLLTHNKEIHPKAIKALNDRGIATPKDVMSRCSQNLC